MEAGDDADGVVQRPGGLLTVIDAAAIRDAGRFTERVVGVVQAILGGAGRLPDERLAPAEPVRFAKSVSRSVTGSMNELITHAIAFLADDISTADVGVRLNDILLSALASGSSKYGRPRDAVAALVSGADS